MSLANEPSPAQVEAGLKMKGEFSPGRCETSTLTHPTEDAPSQHRGPKGYFQGSRKEFLENRLSGYLASKKGNRQKFWHDLYSAWWLRYPWRLDDDKEPPVDDPEKMARLAAVAPGDKAQKALVEQRLTDVWLILYLFMDRC